MLLFLDSKLVSKIDAQGEGVPVMELSKRWTTKS